MRVKQRRTHLVAWIILGPLTIAGIAIAIRERAPIPAQEVPFESSGPGPQSSQESGSKKEQGQ